MSNIKKSSLKKFMFFGIVGAVGTVINTALLYVLTFFLGFYYILASVIATEVAIVSNFVGNHLYTFKDKKDRSPVSKKFLRFQFISISTVFGTVFLLWLFTTLFGQSRLIIWNMAAILIMFMANFALNSKYTWGGKRNMSKVASIILFSLLLVQVSSAQLVSTNQMGFHPNSVKQVIVYTPLNNGNFTIYNNLGAPVYNGGFLKAKNYFNNNVECQGNNPCLVGYFTNLTSPGEYVISTNFNASDPRISVRSSVYSDNIGTLLEFFEAQKQQNSNYHADMHSLYDPPFTLIADGSFIMEAHQASKTLVRLSSAYNRNPAIFDNNMRNTIRSYVEYLAGLQGLSVVEMQHGSTSYNQGFRLIPDVKIHNLFVPGPTNVTRMNVHVPNSQHTISDPNLSVVSLCGANDGSARWRECTDFAAQHYKCQVNEPCINASYIERTGRASRNNGYGVSLGWSTEFGCYFDVNLAQPAFNGQMNPCLYFRPEHNRQETSMALLGFLEALPALSDYDEAYANETFERAYQTDLFIMNNYPPFSPNDPDAGYYATSQFLLYDYTGNITYLHKAHALRSVVTPSVSTVFISDGVRGSEFYWEEYAEHRPDIISAGLVYEYQGKTPEDMFQDKMFYDWKDAGPNAISNTGERVFQFDPNIQFQNSRFMLTEGLLAAKTLDIHPSPQPFVKDIADNQISWMTGMNAVQEGTGQNAPVRSYSFIFGIAPQINPSQFHSRYLINSGIRNSTNGQLVGVRSSGKQFFNGTDYIYLDGAYNILGQGLGSHGNSYGNEAPLTLWRLDQQFNNGQRYIPGWINGVYDVQSNEPDVIYNYRDSVGTYEFTETTNEMVATAVEYFSYLDAHHNNRTPHNHPSFDPQNLEAGPVVIISPESRGYDDEDVLVHIIAPGANSIWFFDGERNVSYDGPDEHEFDDGIINLIAYARSGGTVNSSSVTFLVDTRRPEVRFIAPTPPNRATVNSNILNIAVDATDANLANITINVVDSANQLVGQQVFTSSPAVMAYTAPAPGEYRVKAIARDIVNNDDETNNREIVLQFSGQNNSSNNNTNQQPPMPITIVSPQSGNYNTDALSVNIDAPWAQSIWFSTGSGNIAYTSPTTHIFAQGSNTLTAHANNSAGLTNSTSVTLFVDSISPTIQFVSPTPGSGTTVNSNSFSVRADSIDANLANITIRIQNATGTVAQQTFTGAASGTLAYTAQNPGIHFFEALAADTVNNLAYTGQQNVNLVFGNGGNNNPNNNSNNNTTPSTNSSIISSWSSVTQTWAEGDTAIFNVTLRSVGNVDWTLNGNPIETTATGTSHSIRWAPDIFYTSNVAPAEIRATTIDGTRAWTFDVHNRVNPFFDPSSGTAGTVVHVFTNDNLLIAHNITVGIQSDEGGTTVTRVYTLTGNQVANSETDWRRVILNEELNFGNNYLSFVNVTTSSGQNLYYEVPTSGSGMRAFHKPLPGGGGSGGSGSGGGGGGGGGGGIETLALVYAVIGNNVVAINEPQTITLDARSSQEVDKVTAYLLREDGTYFTVPLELTDGSGGYGTWSSIFSVPEPGLYVLSFVEIDGRTKVQNFTVTERSFYAVSDSVAANEKLSIIYTALETSRVDSVRNVTLTLDARDFEGVKEATALISKRRGIRTEEFTINLELISGTEKYGTWRGFIPVDEPDTTYTVVSVTLSDGISTKIYDIEDRSIYATSALPDNGRSSFITGGVISEFFARPYERPLFPFIFASFVVVVVVMTVIAHSRVQKNKLAKNQIRAD